MKISAAVSLNFWMNSAIPAIPMPVFSPTGGSHRLRYGLRRHLPDRRIIQYRGGLWQQKMCWNSETVLFQ